MKNCRLGFTLTELLISTAIMVVVMGGVLSSMTAVMDYTNLGRAEDDLTVSGKLIINQIESDITLSGWYDPTGKNYQSTSVKDRGARYYPYIQVQDYDSSMSVSSLGSKFPLHARTKSLVQLPLWTEPATTNSLEHIYDALPGKRADAKSVFFTGSNALEYKTKMESYYSSFFARSQEIIFLRSSVGSSGRDDYQMLFPKDNADAWRLPVNGTTATGVEPQKALGILSMSEYQRASFEMQSNSDKSGYGVQKDSVTQEETVYRIKGFKGQYHIFDPELPTAWLDWNGGDFSVQLRWETVEPIDSSTISNPDGSSNVSYTNVDRTNGVTPAVHILSEYSYIVVPSKVGVGRLVRCVKKKTIPASANFVSTAGPGVGDVISRGVDVDELNSPTTFYLVVDKVLSDDVARITFDTIRTSPMPSTNDASVYGADGADWIKRESLEVNQVKYRIYMVKGFKVGGRDVVVYRRLEGIMNMRAKSSASDVDADRTAHKAASPSPMIR